MKKRVRFEKQVLKPANDRPLTEDEVLTAARAAEKAARKMAEAAEREQIGGTQGNQEEVFVECQSRSS